MAEPAAVTVIGAGVAGLACALELAERGARVELLERGPRPGAACSWYAGGMLAPGCELEGGEEMIGRLGAEALAWWRARFDGTVARGTLVVAHGRDRGELVRFSRVTRGSEWLDRDGVAALEPELAGRFEQALYFRDEGHVDARAALAALAQRLESLGALLRFGVEAGAEPQRGGWTVDCRGLAARDRLADLRGVKGEMLLLRLRELSLSRPVRMLHPRLPLYIVPRSDGRYLLGASMIESDESERVSARSVLELLSGAYALHPAFGEAEVLELGTGVRPAFPDNLPRIRRRGATLYVNGLYRHGFLLAPALARRTAEALLDDRVDRQLIEEVDEADEEDSRQRRLA